jgi:hypothetical protein
MRQPKLPDDVLQYFRSQGARGGKIAGQKMTAAERSARAKIASQAAAIKRSAKANIAKLNRSIQKIDRALARPKKKHATKGKARVRP